MKIRPKLLEFEHADQLQHRSLCVHFSEIQRTHTNLRNLCQLSNIQKRVGQVAECELIT
jgi:hypothetical protein